MRRSYPISVFGDAPHAVHSHEVAGPLGPPFLVDVVSRRQKLEFRLLLLIWGATVALFWCWWLDPAHVDKMWVHP